MPDTTPKKKGRPAKPKGIEADNIENAGEEIVKQRRKRTDLENFGADRVNPGDNARYLRDALVGYSLPPIDISDAKQVEKRIQEYFLHCIERDRKPQVVGLSNWLGISRDTLNTWVRGEYRADTHSDLLKKAMTILEELYVDYMMNGKVNPGSGCFIGKNHFGYKDVQENVLTVHNPLGPDGSSPEIMDKYKTSLPAATMGDSGDSD